jgi:hypothetical protein
VRDDFSGDIDKFVSKSFGKLRACGIVMDCGPSEEIVRNESEEPEGLICDEPAGEKMLQIKSVLTFFDKVLSVASFVVVSDDFLKTPVNGREIGNDAVVIVLSLA